MRIPKAETITDLKSMPLTKKAIADLRRFCQWLDTVPRKCVYPSTLGLMASIHKLDPCPEETLYWLSDA